MGTYIHKTDHRLRIRSDFIRNNPQKVLELVDELNQIDAIQLIKFKMHAGSVAISFDEKELNCEELLEILESHNWTQEMDRQFFIENAISQGAKTFTKGITTLALSKLIGPSFGRALFS